MARDSKLFQDAYAAYTSKKYVIKQAWKPPKNNWGKTKAQKKQRRRFIASRPFYLYALELEDGCFYVGCTKWPEKRLEAHIKGEGAMWTIKHKPIRRLELINTFLLNERLVHLEEDKLTLKYAEKYGIEFVRGGGYCQTKPIWPGYLQGGSDKALEMLEEELAYEIRLHI